jgi:hypothetical protein
MTIFVTLVIIIITVVYIIYPFFSKSAVTYAEITKAPPGRGAIKKTRKAGKKLSDIDSEIERRVSEIREKDKAVCPKCGASYKEGSRFCSQCGADLSANKDES